MFSPWQHLFEFEVGILKIEFISPPAMIKERQSISTTILTGHAYFYQFLVENP